MDFEFTEEHLAFKHMAAEFAQSKLAPMAEHWDENSIFPIDVLREAAQLGMAGMIAKEDIGGAQLNRLDAAIIFEQLATGCISTSAYLSIHNMVTTAIDRYAGPELRSHWGPKLTAMEVISSYCLTEPNSGSDAASLK
ncbi:MAG: acyl-CoA dehydrogenase, partial [Legionella sp.]